MNTKLLASIAVFTLLTAVISTSMMNSAYAAEAPKKDAMKDKAMAKKDAMKDKAMAKKDAMKDKAMAKKDAMKESAGTTASSTTVEVMAGSASPGCETTSTCYSPTDVKVSVGSTIVWKNADSAAHTATSIGSDGIPDGTFDSSLFMAGKSFKQKFDTAGTFEYICIVHPWMKGTVTVN